MTQAITIRRLEAAEAERRLPELGTILADAVAGGASVNFMAGFTAQEGERFWQAQLPGLATGEKLLFVGEEGDKLVATVMLMLAQQPNAPHRAEIGKMLVLRSARRQGLGRRLLTTAEAAAHARGRTLLMLDTETGSAGELLYRGCGWTELGRMPGHSRKPDGPVAETTFFYKQLT